MFFGPAESEYHEDPRITTDLDVEFPWVHQRLKVRVGQVEVSNTRGERRRSFHLA
jgi:hypothetical protein